VLVKVKISSPGIGETSDLTVFPDFPGVNTTTMTNSKATNGLKLSLQIPEYLTLTLAN
jgi:hypothetical protein